MCRLDKQTKDISLFFPISNHQHFVECIREQHNCLRLFYADWNDFSRFTSHQNCSFPEHSDIISCSIEGSPLYLAPETITKQPIGREVDIWACAVIFYTMLVGFQIPNVFGPYSKMAATLVFFCFPSNYPLLPRSRS